MDTKLIDYLSVLARIGLDEKEKELYSGQMESIIKWVDQIGELDFRQNESGSSAAETENLRDDSREDNFKGREAILKNFTSREFDFLKVKKVIEG